MSSDNSSELQVLLDTFEENKRALLNLKIDNFWDFVTMQMLLNRLHISVASRFELFHNSSEIPTYQKLHDFLSKQCHALNNVNLGTSSKILRKNTQIKRPFIRLHSFHKHQATRLLHVICVNHII